MYVHYAKPYALLGLPITVICWWFVYLRGPAAFNPCFFFKLATTVAGLWFLRNLRRKLIFFYQNIGYGERQLLGFAAAVDLGIWAIGLMILLITQS